MSNWGTVADWIVAGGTLVVAAVAVFQDTIRGWFYRPSFEVSTRTEPPDCVAVPFTKGEGTFVADSVYLRLWVQNAGNATEKNVEVFAKELHRQCKDGTWERVATFPPMNLKWSNLGGIYFPSIAPEMGKHCDIGHIVDPTQRQHLREDNPRLQLNNNQTSLAFDIMVAPNHRGHIIGPGKYRLNILVSAENARPLERTVSVSLPGEWYPDETLMLRDGVDIKVT